MHMHSAVQWSLSYPLPADGAHAGLGLANSHAAGTVSMSKVSLDLHLNRAVPTSPRSAAGSEPAAAVLRGHVNFTGVASQCCPAALWPLLAALHQLQQQQQQQQQRMMLQQQGTSQVLPSFGRSTEVSNEGQLRQRHHTSEEPTQDESAAAAVDDGALGVSELNSSQGSSRANEQPGTESVVQRTPSREAAPAAGQEPAAAPVSEAEAALSVQWEVCVQASSETQIEVVADNGVVLLGCGVDMVTLRAASGDGSSMKAQSAADIVAQLSLQVGLHMLFCIPCSHKEVLHQVNVTCSVCPTLAVQALNRICVCRSIYIYIYTYIYLSSIGI